MNAKGSRNCENARRILKDELIPSDPDHLHDPHPIFTELEELHTSQAGSGELEWKERARWVKFEEDVEVDANRWSKPHVGALKLAAAIELRFRINEGVMCFDMKADNLEQIAGK